MQNSERSTATKVGDRVAIKSHRIQMWEKEADGGLPESALGASGHVKGDDEGMLSVELDSGETVSVWRNELVGEED